MKAIAFVLAVTMALTPVLAHAQGTAAAPPPTGGSTPLSLARVQRKLVAAEVSAPTAVGEGLRIEEFINVYGRSIAFDIMQDFDVTEKAVQYGGMTHSEFLNLVTPQVYRQSGVDFLGLALGAAKWAVTRNAEKRRKAEQERIEEEARRLRELAVPLPR